MASVTGPSDMWETGGEKVSLSMGPGAAALEPTAVPELIHTVRALAERSVLTRRAPCP